MNELEMLIGLGAGGALSPMARSLLSPVTPVSLVSGSNLPPPPVQVFEGGHPTANATLLHQVWSGKYWIASGSRVLATPAGGQMYNVEVFIGPEGDKTRVGPIHVPASSLHLDSLQGVTTPGRPVSTVQNIVDTRRLAPGPVLKAPPLSIHAPKNIQHAPVPLYRVFAIEAPHTSCASSGNYKGPYWGDTGWFEDPNAVQWTCRDFYGSFLFGTCHTCEPSGGGPHYLKKGTELWVSAETMTVSWYRYPNDGWNQVTLYRLYRVGSQSVSGWVMQQTVGSLNGIFPSGTAGLPQGLGAEENQMDELEMVIGLGAGAKNPCPPGYGYYLMWNGSILAGPYSQPEIPYSGSGFIPPVPVGAQWKCLPLHVSPTSPQMPIVSRTYSSYAAAQPRGGPLTAGATLRRMIMGQALPGDQRRAPPWQRPPYQYGPLGVHGLPDQDQENQMDEMEFATGLGSAMAMSSFATHRALSPTAHTAPCPTGYHPEQRYVGPNMVQTICVPNPTALAPPIHPRGYSPYAALPSGSPLTAGATLRRMIMGQALPGDQRRAPPRSYGPPYQYGPLGVHGLPDQDMEFAAGLGAVMSNPGFGALGPFGNAATLDPDEYQITGDGVYMWNGNQSTAGSISDANGKSILLNTGDRVTASGEVVLDVGNGKYYAKVQSNKAPNEPEIWVAVEYLAPLSWQKPAAPPPPIAPPKPVQPPNALIPAGKTDYTVPILVGAGVLGAGIIGYALYRSKKGKKGLRHAH